MRYKSSVYRKGIASSPTAISLVNLLIILPDGFLSKNLVLVLTRPSNALSWRLRELTIKVEDINKFLA